MEAIILIFVIMSIVSTGIVYFMLAQELVNIKKSIENGHAIIEKRIEDLVQTIVINSKKDTLLQFPKTKIKPVVKTDQQLYEMEKEREK